MVKTSSFSIKLGVWLLTFVVIALCGWVTRVLLENHIKVPLFYGCLLSLTHCVYFVSSKTQQTIPDPRDRPIKQSFCESRDVTVTPPAET